MAMLKREYGGIQPCWKIGLFRIRLPFIHFKISPPEVVTGLMNACTSYGALAVLITTLGLDPAVAWALVVFETGMYTLNWLLGERTDVEACITLEMLENILEGMPGSPLRRALISSGLGEDTTGGGLETELRQMYYSTGLKGIARKDIGRAETLIFDTLADLAERGSPPLPWKPR